MTMPRLARHFSLVAPNQVAYLEETLPPLEPDWVRIRFEYCGLCGTDMVHFNGGRASKYPVSLGHEWVATVEEVGEAIGFFRSGDIVTSDLNFRCGLCSQCRLGRSHLCEEGQQGLFTNRGFGDRADFHASYLVKCAGPPAPAHALIEPLSCALHSYRWSNASPHDKILVIGAGGIGLCMAFLLSHDDLDLTFDITDRNAERLQRLSAVAGAQATAVETPTDSGYDLVIDVSGTASGLNLAATSLRPGGRIAMMSHLPDNTEVGPFLDAVLHKDLTFTLSYLNGGSENMVEASRLIETHWTEGWDTLLDIVPLEELPTAFAARPDSPVVKTILRR